MRRRTQRPGRGSHRLLNSTFPQPGKERTLESALLLALFLGESLTSDFWFLILLAQISFLIGDASRA